MTEALSSPTSPALSQEGLTRATGRASATRRLGDVVVELGFADREVVEGSASRAREKRLTVGENFVEEGVVTPDQLAHAIAERFGVDHVDLSVFAVDPQAVARVHHSVARRYRSVPIAHVDDRTLLVVTGDPSSFLGIDDLATISGYEVRRALATHESVDALLSRLEELKAPAARPAPVATPDPVPEPDPAAPVVELRGAVPDTPVAMLARSILAQAAQRGATDVHFEPTGDGMRVRYRVDGVVADGDRVPEDKVPGLVSRLKVMADLNAARQEMPQEGRALLADDCHRLDLRVTTLPVLRGEAVVVRLCDTGGLTALEDLGMEAGDLELLRAALGRPHGAVLVAGPRGSGASTTLRAAMSELNTADRALASVEDPVERELAGVKQVQVDPSAGLGFSMALRAVLGSDPDVVMVDDLRDTETSRIALQAAAGSQLVLAAVRADGAAQAISRLSDAGGDPALAAAALDCTVAQRLVRRLCECRTPGAEGFEPCGCERCGGTGFSGRTGIFQITVPGGGEARTLRDHGLLKVQAGITSLSEVLRVL